MNAPTYNVLEKRWIPVFDLEDKVHVVGLQDLLTKAHLYKRFVTPLPLDELALLHVASILASRVHDIQSNAAWESLHETGQFDAELVRSYCSKWHDRFYLQHPMHPWLQDASFESDKIRPITQLDLRAAVGTQNTWGGVSQDEDYLREEDPDYYAWDSIAQCLLTTQVCANAGGRGYGASAMFRSSSVWLQGGNLFETLLYAMPVVTASQRHPYDTCEQDAPVWEKSFDTPVGFYSRFTRPLRRVKILSQSVCLFEPAQGDVSKEDLDRGNRFSFGSYDKKGRGKPTKFDNITSLLGNAALQGLQGGSEWAPQPLLDLYSGVLSGLSKDARLVCVTPTGSHIYEDVRRVEVVLKRDVLSLLVEHLEVIKKASKLKSFGNIDRFVDDQLQIAGDLSVTNIADLLWSVRNMTLESVCESLERYTKEWLNARSGFFKRLSKHKKTIDFLDKRTKRDKPHLQKFVDDVQEFLEKCSSEDFYIVRDGDALELLRGTIPKSAWSPEPYLKVASLKALYPDTVDAPDESYVDAVKEIPGGVEVLLGSIESAHTWTTITESLRGLEAVPWASLLGNLIAWDHPSGYVQARWAVKIINLS